MDDSLRIGNIPQEHINDFYLSLNPNELESVIYRSSGQEINRLLSHLSEPQLRDLFDSLSSEMIDSLFQKIPKNRIRKYLLLASEQNIRKILNSVSDETMMNIFSSVSSTFRSKLLSVLPINERKQWKGLLDEEDLIKREFDLITSKRIDNSAEKEALSRIRELEHQANYRQEQIDTRAQQSELKLQQIQQQIVQSERLLHENQSRAKSEESVLLKREKDLSNKLKVLREEHEKQIQKRIDVKVPEYVENAITALNEKENEYKTKATEWSDKGLNALKLAVLSALLALGYGAFEFSNTTKEEISWLFFGYLMLKGLIVIGLFGAWAKHAFNQSNAYMHEALKRSERTHAISFGKLYLEIYGNDVSKQDMKSIFENWNMESQSAFKDIKQEDFQPQTLDKLKEIIGVMKANSDESATNK